MLIDADQRARLQLFSKTVQHLGQVMIDLSRLHITQAKGDDTGETTSTQSDEATEVEVMSQDYTPFGSGFVNDVSVIQSLQTLVTQVDGIVSLIAQKVGRTASQPHVK